MIREIKASDLHDEYFSLLSQLSGDASGYDPKALWDLYIEMKPNIITFVNVDDSKNVTGSATIFVENKFLHGGSRVGHIEDVVVNKEKRTKGLGKSLVEQCVDFAKTMGCYKVILDCEEDNIPFYAKCGFIPASYSMRHSIKAG